MRKPKPFKMKKLLLFVFTAAFVLPSVSQITITSDDLISSGNVVVMARDNDPDPAIHPGDAGANQNWDFSVLAEDATDTIFIMNPDWTPYYDQFPTSNYVWFNSHGNTYNYFNKSDESLDMVGMVMQVPFLGQVPLPMEPPETVAEFPVEYENMNVQSIEQNLKFPYDTLIIDSIWVKLVSQVTTEVDAWGTMTLPMGTYDVLRIHETREVKDSIWVHTLFGWIYMDTVSFDFSTEHYRWWSNNPETGYMLANMQLDFQTQEVTSVSYLKETPYQDIEEYEAENPCALYPNPFENQLSIQSDEYLEGTFRLYDISGKMILRKGIKGYSAEMELSALKPGFYMYRIYSEQSGLLQAGKIVKR